MTKFEFVLVAVVAVVAVVGFVIYCLCNHSKTKEDLKEEGSTFKDKNYRWKTGHLYPYSKKMDTLVNFFIDNPDKIKIYNEFNIAFYKKDKVLLVWTENKFYAYASYASLCESDSFKPILTYEKERPSYKTMKRIVETEKNIRRIGNYTAVKNDD